MSTPSESPMTSGVEPQFEAPTGAPVRQRRMERDRVLGYLERYALVLLLIALIVLFSVLPSTSGTFPTSSNLNAILGNQSVLALIALASIVPLISGQFDLSVAAVLGTSGVLLVACTHDLGLPLAVACIIVVLYGAVVGIVNGFLVAYVGINALIGTLGVSTLLYGLGEAYSAVPLITVPTALTTFGATDWLGVPTVFFVLLAFAAALYYLLDLTPFGRRLTATGSSLAAARLVGIDVRRTVLSSFVLSGMISAAAGVFQIAEAGSASGTVGQSFLLPALAGAFLGATSIRPGRFNVVGTLVAIFFLAVAVSGLTLLGLAAWIQDVFNGVALVVGVAFSAIIGARRRGGEAV